jgi:excisionase family DNA binding protein
VIDQKEILNSREAADFLDVSVETVVREARAGRLPGRRIGKEWRFSRRVLIEWLARGPTEQDARYRRAEDREAPSVHATEGDRV